MVIVLDTSILISALIVPGTPPDQLYQAWRQRQFTLATSEAQLSEFARVIQYERLQKYLSAPLAQMMLSNLRRKAHVLHGLPSVNISPDPDDNVILATAIAAKAEIGVLLSLLRLLRQGFSSGSVALTISAQRLICRPRRLPD